MKSKLRLFIGLSLVLGIGFEASAANYCMAIRGNGEIEPSHWGAVANVIEKLGLPQKQAGGSSATITMLLIDAIATNKLVKDSPAQRAALLVKSLQGFLNNLTETAQWKDFLTLYKRVNELKDTAWTEEMKQLFTEASSVDTLRAKALIQENLQLLERNYATGVKLGLISPTSYAPLFSAIERLEKGGLSDVEFAHDLADAKFYSGELVKAVSVFGSFNAQTDSNLFFRPGIVDFDLLADQFGRLADFYSMQNASSAEEVLWQQFFESCTADAVGKTWSQLLAAKSSCGDDFSQLIKTHFNSASAGNFALQDVGVTIPSFPSTAVLADGAHHDAVRAREFYKERRDPNFGNAFTLRFPDQLHFGYWGREDLLARIDRRLDRRDEKSHRFMNLGQTKWRTALGLSPAEPGLSPFKDFLSHGISLTSAGGWSDLHPVLLLKASGCENVVYITRRGGESLFGQGVAKRLLGGDYGRDWSLINTSSPEAKKANAKINNNGDRAADMTTLWSKLYNLANPESSMKRALKNADAVLCTSWDNFEINQGVEGMIADSYTSPFYVSPTGGLRGEHLSPLLNPSEMSPDGGYPTFAGCY